MSKYSRNSDWVQHVDLETLRETLLYMSADTRRVPQLSGLTSALEAAIGEIDKAGHLPVEEKPLRIARFLPRARPN